MEAIKQEICEVFGHKLRLRVSGICIQDDAVLLVKHIAIGAKGILWAPPGGGLHYGETVTETLVREFKEETGLLIRPHHLIFVNEYLEDPLHAVELFFKVEIVDGIITKGSDPEMHEQKQIIQEVRFVPFEEVLSLDPQTVHSLFRTFKKTRDFDLSSHFHQNIIRI